VKNNSIANLTKFSESVRDASKAWVPGAAPSLTIAWGDSDYFLNKACTAFRNQFQAQEAVYYGSFDAVQLSPDEFMGLTRASGMFDPTSAYCIRRVHEAKEFWKNLANILHVRVLQNHLLLCIEGSKIPVKFLDQCQRLECLMIPCFQLSGVDLHTYVVLLCRKFELLVSQAGQKFLLECVGDDLYRLENEVQKLSLIFSESKDEVSQDDIAHYLGILREDHAFKLTNLLMERRPADAMVLVADLMQRGESSLAILGIMTRHLRIAIKVAIVRQVESRDYEIARKLQLPAFIIKSYNQYVKKASVRALSHALTLCQRADVLLKTSRCANEDVLIGSIIEAMNA
jgi:DNA polymerase III delta subunit